MSLLVFICRIVGSFETIATALVEQENFTGITVSGEDIAFEARRVSKRDSLS